jgi:hypothetical protein
MRQKTWQSHTCSGVAPTRNCAVCEAGTRISPSRVLGALPKRSWLKRLRRWGLEVLLPLWRYAASKRAATRSRWQ